MANFKPSPGCVNCPKCGGWQVLDYTKRKPNKDPIGVLDYRDCDKCNGAGQIRVEPLPTVKTKRGRKPSFGVDIDTAVPVPVDDLPPATKAGWGDDAELHIPKTCWHINKVEIWGKQVCSDCGKEL